MASYGVVKGIRESNPEGLTVELLDEAIVEQESLVSAAAIKAGHAQGATFAEKKSPFPVETVTLECGKEVPASLMAALEAQANLQHEVERLSKLVAWKAQKSLGF